MKTFGGATILVCGGAGFIGSNFIRIVLSSYPRAKVVCVDALTYAGNKDNLKGIPKEHLTFVKGDITNRALMLRVFAKYKPVYVINFAAESHVDRSIHGGAESFMLTNVLGTTVLLEVLRNTSSVKKFVQVSTDEVYGSLSLNSKKKFTEQTPLAPNSPYASSKAAADLVARSFFVTYGVPVVITRCSNNYGPYQYPEKLIPYSITRLLKGEPIAIYGDGLYVRDWIHVDDHCTALIRSLLDGVPGEVYNIGADDEVTNLSLAKLLLSCLDKNTDDIVFVKDRPGHDRRYSVDSSKVRRELKWKPKHTFKRSFKPTVEWYVENTRWAKRSLARAGVANTHI